MLKNPSQQGQAFVQSLIKPVEAIPDYLNQNTWSEENIEFVKQIMDISIQLEIDAMNVWNDYDNFVGQMSISEKAIFDNLLPNRKLWYLVSAKKAFDKANELFPI